MGFKYGAGKLSSGLILFLSEAALGAPWNSQNCVAALSSLLAGMHVDGSGKPSAYVLSTSALDAGTKSSTVAVPSFLQRLQYPEMSFFDLE